jgi:hypothetical protein
MKNWEDAAGSGRGLFQGSATTFAWRDRQNTKNFSKGSRSSGHSFNAEPVEYKDGR